MLQRNEYPVRPVEFLQRVCDYIPVEVHVYERQLYAVPRGLHKLPPVVYAVYLHLNTYYDTSTCTAQI